MTTRWTIAIATTVALATAVTACSASNPQGPIGPVQPAPGTGTAPSSYAPGLTPMPDPLPAAPYGNASAAGLADPSGGEYVHLSSIQELLAQADAGEAPTGSQPTLDQLEQMVPNQLTPQQAQQMLLQVPANLVQMPSGTPNAPSTLAPSGMTVQDLNSSASASNRTTASSIRGGFRGSGNFRTPIIGGSVHAQVGTFMRPPSYPRGQGDPHWTHGGANPGAGNHHWGNPGDGGDHGSNWGEDGGDGAGWGGGGFIPFGSWDNSFFGGLDTCGCNYLPFDFLGNVLPLGGGSFPFEFYPLLFNSFLYLTPFSLANGTWYPFFPPFYLSAGSLLPYPGLMPPVPPIPPAGYPAGPALPPIPAAGCGGYPGPMPYGQPPIPYGGGCGDPASGLPMMPSPQ